MDSLCIASLEAPEFFAFRSQLAAIPEKMIHSGGAPTCRVHTQSRV
jgi:hypothetical protein